MIELLDKLDGDPQQAISTRLRAFDMAATDRLLVAGMHMHFPGFLRVVGNARTGYDVLLSSVRDKICALPDDTVLYPGHGPTTRVANEKQRNPFL